jgi:hypothetical protein
MGHHVGTKLWVSGNIWMTFPLRPWDAEITHTTLR